MKTEKSTDSLCKRLPYFRLDAGFHLARLVDMTPAERGNYFWRLLIALNVGKRGVMPEADEMLDEAQSYYDQKREAGRRGGLTTQGKSSSGASSGASSHTNKHSGNQSDIQVMRESQGAADASAPSLSSIPSWEEVKAFGTECGFPPERVDKCFRHYEASGWRDVTGHPVLNWRSKVSSWMNRPEIEHIKSYINGAGKPRRVGAATFAPDDPFVVAAREREAREKREMDARTSETR